MYGSHSFDPQSRLLKGDAELINHIYNYGTGGVNDTLLQRYAGGFDKAVTQVFGAGRQYPELEQTLRLNAGRFGTYKTYDLCRELERAREAGLSLDEFQEFVGGSIGLYNGYQRTEYNTMVARSRTAKQWERFKEEKLHYPNIEWLRTSSAKPRAEHLGYAGLILPMDDPFWTNNQPGNLYNCKCDWRSTDKAATQAPDTDYKPAAGLEGNPAQTNELVTERHPYFNRNRKAPGWVNDKAVLQCPDEVCFIERTTPNGNKYLEHRLVGKMSEAAENRIITQLLADSGYRDIKLLPIIRESEQGLRARYYGKDFLSRTKCPDASMGGIMVEYKRTNRANLSINIGAAALKSNIAVIKIKPGKFVSETHIENVVNRQWSMGNRKNLTEIIVINNGNVLSFKRP
ncbi:MAG: hypothetical protein LBH91_03075 [Prevotellaceae bacterium]|nr:hypothetical protein [Prevotellaceae bacterium]